METTQSKDIKSILENKLDLVLTRYGRGYEYAKVIAENDNYYHIFVMRVETNDLHYYIQWSKSAKYFCGIIDFLSTTVNPIIASEIYSASDDVRKEIEGF